MIDLGEDWTVPEVALPRRAPPWRRIHLRPLPRWALVLGLLLALLPGGSTLPRYGLTWMFGVPRSVGDDLTLTQDTMYLVRTGYVAAYRLPDGKQLWAVHTAEPVDTARPVPESAVVLAEATSDAHSRVVALDARTGRILWRAAAASVTDVLSAQRRGVLFLGGNHGIGEVRGVDLRTGAVLWRHPVGSDATFVQVGSDQRGGPARIIFQRDNGDTEVVSEASGQVLAQARLLPRSTPGPQGKPMMLPPMAIGGRLYQAHPTGGTVQLDAYDLATLHLDWRAVLRTDAYEATDCGPVICVGGNQNLIGVDPATGQTRWRTSTWVGGWPVGDGRLMVSNGDPNHLVFAVVDAADLRRPMELGGWTPVGGSDADLVVRYRPVVHAWFGVLDLDLGTVRPLGELSGVDEGSCQAEGRYLACPTLRNEIGVWRYRA